VGDGLATIAVIQWLATQMPAEVAMPVGALWWAALFLRGRVAVLGVRVE
jgi:hypothetical protein